MNMKKLILIMSLFLFAVGSFAQQQGNRERRSDFNPALYKQKMEQFLANKADLTQDECDAFFPLFNEMMDKQRTMSREMRKLMREGRSAQSEEAFQKIMEDIIDLEIEQKKLEKTYYEKFNAVLSWKKMFLVKRAIQEFSMEALKKFYPHRGGHGK
jgi:hypothetical protein